MSEKICLAQSIEELKFILNKSNGKKLSVLPLNLETQLYCIDNKIQLINLYGNLGPRQIRDRLINDFSIDIEPGNIVLDNISAIGSHDVTLRIYDDISATLKLEITKKV